MNKKIITIAEIVFALIFVVLLAVFMATINSKGNSANNQLVDVLESTDSSNVKSYPNGGTVKGSTVEMALDQINSLSGDVNDFFISVKTSGKDVTHPTASTYKTLAGSTTSDDSIYFKGESYNVSNSKDNNYINAKADFLCQHVTNDNGIIIGLTFTQQ